MSRTHHPVYDVFLSHAAIDAAVAGMVKHRLAGAGFSVFSAGDIKAGSDFAKELRQALRESQALIALLTRSHLRSDWLAVEVGAAMAWNTPIYVLRDGITAEDVPAYLRHYPSGPVAVLPEFIEAIRRHAQPLTERERNALVEAYQRIGVPVDQLITDTAAGDELASEFQQVTQVQVPPLSLVRELLRLRKRGELPRLRTSAR
jgi:TIR domain